MTKHPWQQLRDLANNPDDVPIDVLRWAVDTIEKLIAEHNDVARIKELRPLGVKKALEYSHRMAEQQLRRD